MTLRGNTSGVFGWFEAKALVKSPAVAWIVGVAIGTSSTWLPWMQEQGRWGAIAAAVLVTGRRGYSLWKGDNRR